MILSEAPTFSGTLQTIRRHGPQVLDVPVDEDGLVVEVAREHLATAPEAGPTLQAHLHDRELPEPVRAHR